MHHGSRCPGLVRDLQDDPPYSSSARVFVSSAQSDTTEAYAGGLLSKQRVASYAVLVDSKILAQQVSDELGLKIDVGELSEMVTAAVVGDTVVLELEVIATDPTRAQLIAQDLRRETRRDDAQARDSRRYPGPSAFSDHYRSRVLLRGCCRAEATPQSGFGPPLRLGTRSCSLLAARSPRHDDQDPGRSGANRRCATDGVHRT